MKAIFPIPLGFKTRMRFSEIAQEQYPNRKNFETPESTVTLFENGYKVLCRDNGRYSNRCTYTHWTYPIKVTCFGILTKRGDLVGRLSKEKFKISPPKGYWFELDQYGFKLVKGKDDYHFDILELLNGEIKSKFLENKKKRIENEKKQKLEKKLLRGSYICIKDSILAGNCLEGTLSFCKKYKIRPKSHVKYNVLLNIFKKENPYNKTRIINIFNRVSDRIRRENERGYSLLEEHYMVILYYKNIISKYENK